MTTRYVVGIDTGTGGCKVTFLSDDGEIVAESNHPYPSYSKHPRWVEQDPDDWVRAAFDGIAACLRTLRSGATDAVDGIAFSAPHHTAVLLDDADRPVRPAILWNDQRADAESADLQREHGELLRTLTFNAPAPTWTLPQLLWLSRNESENLRRARSLLFMKDYVRFQFTGEKLTDYIDAGGSLFFDVAHRRWASELTDLAGLEVSLPRVVSPASPAGWVTATAAQRCGLKPGTPVFVGTADTAAEVFGTGGVREGDLTVKLATAGNVQRIQARPAASTEIISYEHPVDGLYYLNSATNAAAAAFRWFRETLYPIESAQQPLDDVHRALNAQIEAVPPGSSGTVFTPFLNGERSPYWDPRLRAAFLGMTASTGRSTLARAVMEGVAYSVKDAASVYKAAPSPHLRLIGGGAKSPVWRQIIADVFDSEVVVPRSTEASFGTCLIAARGAGWFTDLAEAVESLQTIAATVEPDPAGVRVYRELFGIYQNAVEALTGVSHRLTTFAEEGVS